MRAIDSIQTASLAERRNNSRASSFGVKKRFPALARVLLPPLVVTVFLWLASANDITIVEWFAALILLFLPWAGYCRWRARNNAEVPLFSMLAMIYWLYYAFPLFWGTRDAVARWNSGQTVSREAVTGAMVMVLLGVLSLWAGVASRIGKRFVPRIIPTISSDNARWGYLRAIMFIGSLVSFYEVSPDLFGEGMMQMMFIFQNIIPLVAFAILFQNVLRGRAPRYDLFLLAIFITFRFIVDMSSGWLGALVYDVITCAVIYVVEKRRIPRLAVVGVILYVLFFQVGKYSVREKYWYQQNEDTKVERIAFWVSESFGKWGEAFNDSSLETLRDLTYNSLSRVALLNQTANVLELTPSTVPYQYGRLYSYMAIALVPRFVWPEKPSVNEANMFYQVAYGITAEEDLEKSSFAIGILTESYINFGWPGVVLMMFLIGIFLDFFQQTFLSGSSGFLLNGLGFVLIPFLLSIDSQLAFYLGGMAQRIFFVLLIFLPIIRFRRTRRRAGSVEQA